MATTFEPALDLELIEAHPSNVRRHASADDDLVASVKANGLVQPLIVAPHPDDAGRYRLIAGHRRTIALVAAGRATAPAVIRTDLVTEGQQVEAMLIENGRRSDLSAIEEAEGYQQLELFGYKPKDIAQAVGRSTATVASRLKLLALPESARESVHGGQATLADAETLLEFADDPQVTAELEQAIGTSDFAWRARQARDQRARAARNAEQAAAWEARGVPKVEHPENWTRDGVYPLSWLHGDIAKESTHDGCLAFVTGPPPLLVCTDGAKHRVPVDPAVEERESDADRRRSEWEAQQAEREAKAAARAAASAVRREWIHGHLAAQLPTKSHQPLGKFALAAVPLLITVPTDLVEPDTLARTFDLDTANNWDDRQAERDAFAATLATSTPTKALNGFAGWLAAVIADQLDTQPFQYEAASEVSRVLAVWDWLTAAGYELSAVDREVRAELEVRHTELAGETETDD